MYKDNMAVIRQWNKIQQAAKEAGGEVKLSSVASNVAPDLAPIRFEIDGELIVRVRNMNEMESLLRGFILALKRQPKTQQEMLDDDEEKKEKPAPWTAKQRTGDSLYSWCLYKDEHNARCWSRRYFKTKAEAVHLAEYLNRWAFVGVNIKNGLDLDEYIKAYEGHAD